MSLKIDPKTGHIFDKLHKHPRWKKRWKKFVQYDHDWDSTFFFEIIMHKLYLLREYYIPEHVLMADEELSKIQESLNHTIMLGERLYSFDYALPAQEFAKEHNLHGVIVKRSLKGSEQPLFEHWGGEGETFFNIEKDKSLRSILKEQNLSLKDVKIFFTGKWDSEENYQIYKQKIEDARIAEQKDRDDFFQSISNNYEAWWD